MTPLRQGRPSAPLPVDCVAVLVLEGEATVRVYIGWLRCPEGQPAPEGWPETLRLLGGHEEPVRVEFEDVVMNLLSGRELADTLRKVRPSLPIWMVAHSRGAAEVPGFPDPDRPLKEVAFSPKELRARIEQLRGRSTAA